MEDLTLDKNIGLEKEVNQRKEPKKWQVIFLVGSTIILGIVAVISGYRLYQLRDEKITPTAPEEVPAVTEQCTLTFTIPSPTPTETPIPTATPTPPEGDCQMRICFLIPTLTPTETPVPTVEPTETPMPTEEPVPTDEPVPTVEPQPTAEPTSTPVPEEVVRVEPTPTSVQLPQVGVDFPSLMMIIIGSIISLTGLLIWL